MLRSDTPEPIVLRTRRDATLAAQALEHRADDLEKLAKKNQDEGYSREARTQLADAATIKELILPSFREQGELPLVTPEQVRGGIAEGLRDIIRNSLIVRAPEDRQEDALLSREEALLEKLAIRVEAFAEECAQRGFDAGYSARTAQPNVLVHESISALR